MAINLNEFKSQLSNTGFLKSSTFMVEIIPPAWAFSLETDILRFYCDSAILPGIGVATAENRRQGYSSIEYTGMSPIYNDLSLQFFIDEGGQILKFFHNWVGNIISLPGKNSDNTTQTKNAYAYEVYYKKNYITTITITHFNTSGKEAIKYTINEAFPNIIGDSSVAWADKNQLLRLPVSFKFKNWTSEIMNYPVQSDNYSDNIGETNVNDYRTSSIDGSPTTIPQFVNRPTEIQDILNSIRAVSDTLSIFNSFRGF